MAEIVSTIAATIFEHSLGAIGRQFGYMWNYKKNMDNLKEQVVKLDNEIDDKSHRVTVAERNTDRIRDGVSRWQNDAYNTSKEAKEILQEYEEKGKKRCMMDLCPNLFLRYQFSRRACKKMIQVEQAITKADRFIQVSDPAVGQGIARALSTKAFFTFDSRKSTLEDIMKTLQDETMNTIGVYGLGGMGKTTLAKQVASRAAEDKMFEEIVMGSITQTVDMKEIQGQIASMLDLKLEESTVAQRASRIYARLQGKKVLVILDDLWKELDLKKVGIPFGTKHMGCKILLTSRFLPVLASMGTKKEFLLGALKEEESWKLFEEKTVEIVRKSAFHTIGKEVAKRCEGLPVLIVTVAASLSKRPHMHAWKDALKQLKKMNYQEMHDIVNSAIESISYKHLEKRHKQLFLLCGVIGGDVSIEKVFQYSLGWGLFDEEVMTIEQVRNSLHTMILNLKESCLLLDGDSRRDRNFIKMHDVVRDVAISIAKKELNVFLARDNDELNTWPKEDVLRRCTTIVFCGFPNLSRLPQLLECPSLELFVLSGFSGDSSPLIPDTFFERTNKLRVLGMSSSYFSALPSSLSFLKNLQTLRVDDCYGLKDVSIVGELKKLQTLSFSGCSIEELPSGIGQLSELRLLDLSFCSRLKTIPAGLIAGLSQLEELYMKRGFDRWDVEGCHNSSGISNVSLAELKHLPKLNNLEIAIPNVKLLSENMNFVKWEKYEIIVGDMWGGWRIRSWLDDLEITKKVCLQLSTIGINHLPHVVERFKITECLCLGRLKGVKNLTPELDGNGFPDMKHLRIKHDDEIQYIVNVDNEQHNASFPVLESLHLSHMLKLQKICNGRLMEESFYSLKIVKVKNCNNMESLFSFSMAIGLGCLQEIQVSNCSALEKIVAEKNREDDVDVNSNGGVREQIEFVQLRKLFLKCLLKLNNFFSNDMMGKEGQKSLTSDVESNKIISEEAQFKSSMPLFEKVSFPNLEELELDGISNLTEIWSHKLSQTFCSLTDLTIENCDNLKYLFTPSITTALVGLQKLTIQNCARMKQIVEKGEGVTKIETITFPQLNYLYLYNLSNLTTFYSESDEEMDPDENLDIVVQPLFSDKVSFPKMETLLLSQIPNLTEIWSHQVQETPCCNLTSLSVNHCDKLKYLLTPSITTSLRGLQQLTIGSCERMKQVVAKEEGESKMETISFPQLSNLCLYNLSNLTTFYSESDEEMGTKENLETVIQPLLSEKVKFPSLKQLDISNCDAIKTICPNMSRRTHSLKKDPHEILSFQTLQKVEVYGCRALEYVIPFYVAQSLNQLEKFSIRNCGVETIIGDDKDAELEKIKGEVSITFTFPKLVEFNLNKLSKLKCFYPREHTIQWPALENLEVHDCDKVKIFPGEARIQPCMFPLFSIEKAAFPLSMNFRNLLEIEIDSCGCLKYLFTPSIAMALEKVQKLTITNCSMMKVIVGNEERGPTIYSPITFPQLIRLRLQNLPILTRSYSAVEEMDSNKKIDSDAQPLFDEKIQFPRLEQLRIAGLNSIETIWQNQHLYQVNSFCKLKEIEIRSCASLLEIYSDTKSTITQKYLEESQEMFRFENLCNVIVRECKSLKHVFPVYVAQSLQRIRYMSIENCEVLKTIIGDENYRESSEEMVKSEHMAITFVFPELNHLTLVRLSEVEYLYPKKHTIEWPALKVLNVDDCDKVSTLDFLNVPEKQGDNQFEKVISNLEFLSIRGKDMMKILRQYVQFPPHLFRRLEWLTITEFHGETIAFLSKFLSIIHNQLRTFRVHNCSFQEIFLYEGEVTNHVDGDVLLPQLRELQLEKLPELKYICKQDQSSSFIPTFFGTLGTLTIVECPRLSNLVPSSVSFTLLKYLTISSCDGLINLIEPSIARSLKQLRMLIVSGCKMIEEIISDEVGDDVDEELASCGNEIVFNKLWCLKLEKLPGLTSFCSSRNYTFNFPKLGGVDVTVCPNLKTFCGGTTTTPKLQNVYYGSEWCWEGDLNATVERVFAEMEAKRLATTLPSISSTNHSEAQAQPLENPTEYLTKSTMEGHNATNQEKAAEKHKGKELEVYEEIREHFEKTEEAPHCSDPCSNYAAQEQTVAASLSSSQLVVASSPLNSNLCGGVRVSPSLATQVEVQTPEATVSTTSSNNQFEVGAQIHDKSPKKSTVEPRKEGHICRNDTEELGNEAEIYKNATQPGKESEEAQGHTITLPSTSSNRQSELEAESHKKSIEELIEPTKEGQISKHITASSSQRKDFEGLRVAKEFMQSLGGFLQILETQPLKIMNAEQFQCMEDAFSDLSNMNFSVDLLCPYVHKARKCMQRKKEISELELKIAEAEEQVHAMKAKMKEEKKALEEEYEAIPL